MASTNPHPRVGVAAVVANRAGKIVAGKRKSSHGAGSWQFPGGHLEFGESFFACAEREALEETGLKVRGARVLAVTNDVFTADGKHYITIFVQCTMEEPDATPEVLEPDKCESWHWLLWDELRDRGDREGLFLPIVNLFKDHPNIQSLM